MIGRGSTASSGSAVGEASIERTWLLWRCGSPASRPSARADAASEIERIGRPSARILKAAYEAETQRVQGGSATAPRKGAIPRHDGWQTGSL